MTYQKKTYITYSLLASIITFILFTIQAKFILKIQLSIISYVVPCIAGILFGYLIARVNILSDEHKRLASTDHLTQLSNRKKFYEYLEREILRSKRHNSPLSIILLDIDHFKNINDTFGHQTGDSVLVDLAKILNKMCRRLDLCARWGGEEFIILLSETDLSGALRLAERIRSSIEMNSFEIPHRITCSFGVSQYDKADEKFEALIERADQALYRAKEGGRNRAETG